MTYQSKTLEHQNKEETIKIKEKIDIFKGLTVKPIDDLSLATMQAKNGHFSVPWKKNNLELSTKWNYLSSMRVKYSFT